MNVIDVDEDSVGQSDESYNSDHQLYDIVDDLIGEAVQHQKSFLSSHLNKYDKVDTPEKINGNRIQPYDPVSAFSSDFLANENSNHGIELKSMEHQHVGDHDKFGTAAKENILNGLETAVKENDN